MCSLECSLSKKLAFVIRNICQKAFVLIYDPIFAGIFCVAKRSKGRCFDKVARDPLHNLSVVSTTCVRLVEYM